MCLFGSQQRQPMPLPLPALPPIDGSNAAGSAASRQAMADQKKKLQLAQGQGSTVTTSPFGDTSAANVVKNTLG